jgi:tetratricopeptide (TPR) repeat protein
MSIPSEYFDEAMEKLRSEKFLNRPLESVVHPVSEVTKRITEAQKYAASEAEPVEKEKLTAQEWLERGYVFASNGDFDEAIRCLTESIHLNPTYKAYYNRGIIRRYMEDFDGAIHDYDEAIAIDPTEAQTYNNRGNVHRDMGDLEGALADYDKALSLSQGTSLAYINRGIVRTAKVDIDAGLADFNEALTRLVNLDERA